MSTQLVNDSSPRSFLIVSYYVKFTFYRYCRAMTKAAGTEEIGAHCLIYYYLHFLTMTEPLYLLCIQIRRHRIQKAIYILLINQR